MRKHIVFDRIHHAGIAVANLHDAKATFADALGLRVDTTRSPLPEGNKQRSGDPTDILDVPIGDAEFELNAPPTDGTPPGGTHRFLQARGAAGALHHICLHSTQVADDVAHLRASGLQQLASPEEIEAGPWQGVTFFHPRSCMGILLEIWPQETHRVGRGSQGEGIFTRMDHIGVVTTDLEAARRFWCNVIGLRVDVLRSPIGKGRHDDSDNVNVLDIPIGSGEIECIQPQDTTSGTARFLAKYGGSVGGAMHHISLAARDVKAAADFVQANGMKLIGPASNDRAWVHPVSAMGSLIEIVRDED